MTQTPLLKTSDQRILQSGITWQQFKLIQAGFGEIRNVRLFYYDSTIEILMPGREHEFFSRVIGFLMGLFCLEMGIEFEPLGSTTQENPGEAVAEPDESYCFGFGASKPLPDLVIEVVFTSGTLSKLQRYQAIGIPEVWFWEDGVFSLYRLQRAGYERIFTSQIPELESLNIDLLTRCVLIAQSSRLEAASTLRQGLKENL